MSKRPFSTTFESMGVPTSRPKGRMFDHIFSPIILLLNFNFKLLVRMEKKPINCLTFDCLEEFIHTLTIITKTMILLIRQPWKKFHLTGFWRQSGLLRRLILEMLSYCETSFMRRQLILVKFTFLHWNTSSSGNRPSFLFGSPCLKRFRTASFVPLIPS